MSQPADQNQHLAAISKFGGFFAKTLEERRALINSTDQESTAALNGELEYEYANKMIENYVGTLSIPVGICPYLVMDNVHYVVPMATEEPSVIAACSAITKLVATSCDGFTTTNTGNNMVSQIQITFAPSVAHDISTSPNQEVGDEYDQCLVLAQEVCAGLLRQKKTIIAEGNEHCPRMVQRGGGVYDFVCRVVEPTPFPLSPEFQQTNVLEDLCQQNQHADTPVLHSNLPSVCIYLRVNVCDAMGANVVNSIAEALAPQIITHIEEIIAAQQPTTTNSTSIQFAPQIGLRILSNLCVDRMVTAQFAIPISKLVWKSASGQQVADGVIAAFQFARDDIFRAVTHNKGVMNGITAVALACGQDTRAIEASIHAYAGSQKRFGYKPVTEYWIDQTTETFHGRIHVPIAVGTKGGALGQHKLFKWSLDQLHQPNSATLAAILACIGLAQNFAAMRALAIEGIQNGHMRLHARKQEQ